MLTLQPSHVLMQQTATDKAHALQILADFLVAQGLTTPDYLAGLQQRETQSATYLGQGIAIPHGTPESRTAIIETGVRLVHFPTGVVWDTEGNTIYLAVVIAAKSDEHLQVLQLLTKALADNVENAIKHATTAEQIIDILNGKPLELLLHENLIVADSPLGDIDDLIFQAGNLLKQQKLVNTGFISSLNFSNAVHLFESRWAIISDTAVNQPAVSIVRLRQPITLPPSATANPAIEKQRLALAKLDTLVCIANHPRLAPTALADFLDIMLTPHALPDNPTREQIARAIGAQISPQWQRQSVQLLNAHGLHARPATALVKVCQPYEGEILVSADDSPFVSAKSLTKLLSLGATRGQTLHFIAEPNTPAATGLAEVIAAVKSGLGEVLPVDNISPISTNAVISTDTITTFPITTPPITTSSVSNHSVLNTLNSTSLPQNSLLNNIALDNDVAYPAVIAAAGFAYGEVWVKRPLQFNFEQYAANPMLEKQRLTHAIDGVKAELNQLIQTSSVASVQAIFAAHVAMLDDPELLAEVNARIDAGNSAAGAWSGYIDAAVTTQSLLKNTLLAERAADLRDIGDKVLMKLCNVVSTAAPTEPYIMLMADIVPSEVATLDKNRIVGIVTAVGGASSHAAIVARALGIPTLVGAGEAILQIADGSKLLLNAETGHFYVNPHADRVATMLTAQQNRAEQLADAQSHCLEPAMTGDNHGVEVAVNIGDIHHTAHAVTLGAEAVGLLRTELVFMSHSVAPDEAMQQQAYKVVLDALQGRPLVVRTLDIGGDKPLPYLPMPHEENPFLGMRGIRLTLRRPELLKQQLSALLNAAAHQKATHPNHASPLRIMFPMVGRFEEWQAAKAILDEVHAQIPCDDLQVGIMIEVPSAALIAPVLAKEVDFFSIGTNDLTQYTLAIDRGHPTLSAEADGLHPSVLMLIEQTVKAAHAHGKWVGVCGELANDTKAVPILVGLGVDELSVSAGSIPLLKAQIRTLNFSECQTLAKQALNCATATEVRGL